jgi:hypothetical protein
VSDHRGEPSFDGAEGGRLAARGDEGARWTDPPTHKARAGVQRAVERLLGVLAPERTVVRATRPPEPVERYRTPSGCILQAPTAAVTVSWFPDVAGDAGFGELQVLAWRGVVSRPGSARRAPGGATITRALVLRPEERAVRVARGTTDADGTDDGEAASAAVEWGWRAEDGARYDSDTLAAYCLSLLERQSATV